MKKIIAVVALIIALLGFGTYIGATVAFPKTYDNTIDIANPDSFKLGAEGTIAVDLDCYILVDDIVGIYSYIGDGEEEGLSVILEGLVIDRYTVGFYEADTDEYGRMLVNVTVNECPQEIREGALDYLTEYFGFTYEYLKEQPDADPMMVDYFEVMSSPEGRAANDESMSHLMCSVTSSFPYAMVRTISIIVAVVGTLIAMVCALSIKFKVRTNVFLTANWMR